MSLESLKFCHNSISFNEIFLDTPDENIDGTGEIFVMVGETSNPISPLDS